MQGIYRKQGYASIGCLTRENRTGGGNERNRDKGVVESLGNGVMLW